MLSFHILITTHAFIFSLIFLCLYDTIYLFHMKFSCACSVVCSRQFCAYPSWSTKDQQTCPISTPHILNHTGALVILEDAIHLSLGLVWMEDFGCSEDTTPTWTVSICKVGRDSINLWLLLIQTYTTDILEGERFLIMSYSFRPIFCREGVECKLVF